MHNTDVEKKKGLSRRSISYQFILFLSILITIVVVLLVFVYQSFSSQILRQNWRYTSDTIANKHYVINNELEDYSDVMLHMTFNKDVQKFLKTRTAKELFINIADLDDYMNQIGLVEKDIEDVLLLEGYQYYNLYYDEDLDGQIADLSKNIRPGTRAQYLGILTMDDENYMVLGNTIYDLEKVMVEVGKLLVVINYESFVMNLEADHGSYYVVDGENQVVFGTDAIESLEPDEIDIEVRDWYLEDMSLRLVGVETTGDIDEDARQMWILFGFIVGTLVLVVIVSSVFVARNVIAYLIKIHQFIGKIGEGDLRKLKERLDVEGPEEISQISHEINILLDEVKALTSRLVASTGNLYKAEISQKEAELSYLKNQINPHFLYNTLSVVKGIAISHGEKEIDEITSALVKIFRYSVKGENFVELRQELNIIKAYVAIQSIRFEQRFEVIYDIEDHLYDVKIQKMILQPLLENAIQYGIEPSYSKGQIVVKAEETEFYIELSVSDNGVGMEKEKVMTLNQMLNADHLSITDTTKHVGLQNVHRRLQHYYGEGSGLTIESEMGQGTTVTIRIASEFIE